MMRIHYRRASKFPPFPFRVVTVEEGEPTVDDVETKSSLGRPQNEMRSTNMT